MPILSKRRGSVLTHGSRYAPAAGGGGGGGSTNAFDPAMMTFVSSGISGVLSNGNLTFETTTGNFSNVLAVQGSSTGKYYWEVTVGVLTGISQVGFGNAAINLTSGAYMGQGNNAVGWAQDTNVYSNGGSLTAIAPFVQSDILSVAIDFTAKLVWFRRNAGNWNNNGSANPATGAGGISFASLGAGPYYAAVCVQNNGDKMTANFGATAFAQSQPSGFGTWP